MKEMLSNLPILPILLVILAVVLLAIIMSGYVKASLDQAIIISGLRKPPRTYRKSWDQDSVLGKERHINS